MDIIFMREQVLMGKNNTHKPKSIPLNKDVSYGPCTDLRDILRKAEKKTERLKESETKRKKSQKDLEGLTYKQKERVKELNCPYTISSIVEKQGVSLEEVL